MGSLCLANPCMESFVGRECDVKHTLISVVAFRQTAGKTGKMKNKLILEVSTMKVKSLFLGSAAAVALSSGAMAADPIGVALDTCSLLDITGLTVSSETNCLRFSGEVSYEFVYDLSYDGGPNDAVDDSESNFDWEFTMEATADSDFGPARAVVTLVNGWVMTDYDDVTDTAFVDDGALVDEAFVSIGDQTVITAGKTGSIANEDDDTSFGYFEQEFADIEDIDFDTSPAERLFSIGGHVIQVSHDAGNGVSVSVGLEHLQGANFGASGARNYGSLVGVVAVDQDWGTAHFTVVADDVLRNDTADQPWLVHTGATFNATDDLKLRAAAQLWNDSSNNSNWRLLGASEYTFDMFTLALAAGANSIATTENWWVELSGNAEVTEGITFTAAYLYDSVDSNVSNTYTQSFAAEIGADVSDNLTLTAGVEHVITTVLGVSTDDTDVSAELAWAPGGGYEASVGFEADTDGDDTTITAEFSKAFE